MNRGCGLSTLQEMTYGLASWGLFGRLVLAGEKRRKGWRAHLPCGAGCSQCLLCGCGRAVRCGRPRGSSTGGRARGNRPSGSSSWARLPVTVSVAAVARNSHPAWFDRRYPPSVSPGKADYPEDSFAPPLSGLSFSALPWGESQRAENSATLLAVIVAPALSAATGGGGTPASSDFRATSGTMRRRRVASAQGMAPALRLSLTKDIRRGSHPAGREDRTRNESHDARAGSSCR